MHSGNRSFARPEATWLVTSGWLVLCISFALIIFASLQSVDTPKTGLHWDKVYHALAYAVLTTGFVFALPRISLRTVFFCAVGLGAVLEILQGTMTIGRTASIWDALANAIGTLLVIGLWMKVCPLLKHNPA